MLKVGVIGACRMGQIRTLAPRTLELRLLFAIDYYQDSKLLQMAKLL